MAWLQGSDGKRVSSMARQIDAETMPSLLLRLRQHDDTAAWDSFVEVYSPLIYGFCRLRKLQATDAADITQEVLVRVSKAIRAFEYDRERGLFRDWLARIVGNEVSRHLSKQTRRQTGSEQLVETIADTHAEHWNEHFHQHIFDTALERCRPSFSPDTWQLFQRSWLEKIPAKQVAESENVSIDAVYVARSRVLKRLRREVESLAEDVF